MRLSARRRSLAVDLPWFVRPVPVFTVVQLVPLALWLLIPESMFSSALQGFAKAPLSVATLLAYGSLVLAFASGAAWGSRATIRYSHANAADVAAAVHWGGLALAVSSTGIVLFLIVRSGVSVSAVIAAAQANIFKQSVYTDDITTQVMIMARHLILSAMIGWCVLRTTDRRARTLVPIVLSAAVLFTFTSSRLTAMGLVVIGLVFFARERQEPSASGSRSFLRLGLLVSLVVLLFALGVYIRSRGTWEAQVGGGGARAAIYELLAYLVSPVNYSAAFAEHGVAFARGFGASHFGAFIYTALNVPVDDSYRTMIGAFYNPSLNQIGLVGEWFTILGPFLWVPAVAFGCLSGMVYRLFVNHTTMGLLIYPLFVIAIMDSGRGFLLAQNVLASNLIFVSSVIVIVHVWRSLGTMITRRPHAFGVRRV